jgi:hypothetical protein
MLVRYSSGPQLVPSDANTDFGTAVSGGMIAVPVRNEGGGVARHLTAVVDGDKDDFEVDLDTCRNAVLMVDGQCWMRVYFRPKSTGEHTADIGVVADDSAVVWTVTFTGEAAPEPAPIPTNPVVIGHVGTVVRVRPLTGAPINRPAPLVRPGAPAITRTTLAGLRRAGLRFTQQFGMAEQVTWTLESHGTVLARTQRAVAVGRTSVTLKLTSAGKRVLAQRKPKTLTLRTKGTLERVTTVKLRPVAGARPAPRTRCRCP